MMYQVDVGYACAGVEVKDGYVIDTAPIFKWMIGKPFEQCWLWVKKKHGTMKQVGSKERSE